MVIPSDGHITDCYIRNFSLRELFDQDILNVYYNGAGVVGRRSHIGEMFFTL
jgi:hypothetical protein